MLKQLALAAAITLTTTMSGPSASMQDGDFPLPSAPPASAVDGAPPQYWSPPNRPVAMLFGSPREVNDACGRTPGYITLACTMDGRVPISLMPNPCLYQHEYYAKLLCHELGHVSRPGLTGWRH